MWMLREGRGMVDIVLKINQFFPNKLPQYQDQCVSVCVTCLNVLYILKSLQMKMNIPFLT